MTNDTDNAVKKPYFDAGLNAFVVEAKEETVGIKEKIAKALYMIFYELTGGDVDSDDWTEGGCLSSDYCFRKAEELLAIIKEAGYVKLANDQNLPAYKNSDYMLLSDMGRRDWDYKVQEWKKVQQDMLKASWRKVEMTEGIKEAHFAENTNRMG